MLGAIDVVQVGLAINKIEYRGVRIRLKAYKGFIRAVLPGISKVLHIFETIHLTSGLQASSSKYKLYDI